MAALAPVSAVITSGVEALGIDANGPNFITEPVEVVVSLCSQGVEHRTGKNIYSVDYL